MKTLPREASRGSKLCIAFQMVSGFPDGHIGVCPERIQQRIQIFFMGEAVGFFLTVKAHHQIAQGTVDLPVFKEALGYSQTLVHTFHGRQRNVSHPAEAEHSHIQRLVSQSEILIVGAANPVGTENFRRKYLIG